MLKSILREAKQIDQISSESGLTAAEAGSLLAMLEIRRVVRQLPGKVFALIPSP
ncbi:hypothetical protein ACFL52_04625 [Candidatus Margulisiibacteriota bacterium]